MPDRLAVDIKASLNWSFQEQLALATMSDVSKLEYATSLADGTDDNQADKLWHDERVISPVGYEDLNLTNLIRSIFGNTISTSLASVKLLLIINNSTTTGDDLIVGGAANNAWSAPFNADPDAKIELPADSTLLLTNKPAGWTVTEGASDILRIDNPTESSIVYRIVIVGTSS